MRISIRYKYRHYPQAPELTERSKRLCSLTHPLWGCALGCVLGTGLCVLGAALFPSPVAISIALMVIGMISGPILLHTYRKKMLARYDEEYMQLIKALQKDA